MRAVDSLHFQVEIEIAVKSADASMTIPVSFEGDYQAPDRARGALKMSLGFFEVESETITIGNDAYFTNPETGLWEAGSLEDVPLVQPTDLLEVGSVPVKGLALAGRETIGGAPAYRLTGTIPAESVLGEGDTAGDLQIEYWITEEDSLIRRVALEGDLGAGDDVMFFGGNSPSPSSTTLNDDHDAVELRHSRPNRSPRAARHGRGGRGAAQYMGLLTVHLPSGRSLIWSPAVGATAGGSPSSLVGLGSSSLEKRSEAHTSSQCGPAG